MMYDRKVLQQAMRDADAKQSHQAMLEAAASIGITEDQLREAKDKLERKSAERNRLIGTIAITSVFTAGSCLFGLWTLLALSFPVALLTYTFPGWRAS